MFGLSLGRLCCPWAVRVVVEPGASSFGLPCRPWAVRVVAWPAVLSFTLGAEVSGGGVRGKGSFSLRTGWASHCLGPPFRSSSPFALSCIEQAHIPQWRGGAPRGLSSMVGTDVGRRGGDGGGGVERKINQHQRLMRLMFNSNSDPTRHNHARS